jgi:hypothetical protein
MFGGYIGPLCRATSAAAHGSTTRATVAGARSVSGTGWGWSRAAALRVMSAARSPLTFKRSLSARGTQRAREP